MERLEKMEEKVAEQIRENSLLLERLKKLQNKEDVLQTMLKEAMRQEDGPNKVVPDNPAEAAEDDNKPVDFSNEDIAVEEGDAVDRSRPVIPVLLIACNRYAHGVITVA